MLVFPRMKYPSGDFSLGLAYLSAYLKKNLNDIEIKVLDTTFNPSFEYVQKIISKENPDIIGIYIDTLMYDDAVKIAKIAKSQEIHIIAGGPHASLMPESLLSQDCFDAAVIGEAEDTFNEYIEQFFTDQDFEKVNGIIFKKDGKAIKTLPRQMIKDINEIPDPDVEIFDIEKYIQHFVQLDSYNPKLRGISMIISRGCPYNCTYCQPTLKQMFGHKLRIFSPERVVNMIKSYIDRYNIQAIYFQDDTLTIFKKWMDEFCDLMIKDKVPVVWACNTRANTIDLPLLKKMKAARCVKLKVGIEAYSDRIREGIYKKGITIAQVDNLIKWCKKLKIQVTGFFMLGAPTETEKEVKQTINYAISSDLMEANFSITTPLPHTELYNMAIDKGWHVPKNFSDYDYYQVKRRKMTENQISDKKLAKLKKWANIRFYTHPKRVPSVIKSFISVQGLKKVGNKIKRI